MKTTVGVFRSRADAQEAVRRLQAAGIGADRINLLAPGGPEAQLEAVPTSETEQPGTATALGGVVGAATGIAGGVSLGAVASLIVPGVGPVMALGSAAAALLGLGGAITGAAAGHALEDKLSAGLPRDELYVYRDALTHGRTVLAVLANDEEETDAARAVLEESGAETLDAARENWTVGLGDVRTEEYRASSAADIRANARPERAARSDQMSAQMRRSMGLCLECHAVCLETVTHCLRMGGAHSETTHVRLLQDCAAICETSASFMRRGSNLYPHICDLCAEVCERCARDCERFADETMIQCADVCQRCAEACRETAAAGETVRIAV